MTGAMSSTAPARPKRFFTPLISLVVLYVLAAGNGLQGVNKTRMSTAQKMKLTGTTKRAAASAKRTTSSRRSLTSSKASGGSGKAGKKAEDSSIASSVASKVSSQAAAKATSSRIAASEGAASEGAAASRAKASAQAEARTVRRMVTADKQTEQASSGAGESKEGTAFVSLPAAAGRGASVPTARRAAQEDSSAVKGGAAGEDAQAGEPERGAAYYAGMFTNPLKEEDLEKDMVTPTLKFAGFGTLGVLAFLLFFLGSNGLLGADPKSAPLPGF